jgi:hypothetical protein
VAFGELQIVHDQAGLVGAVNVELCFGTGNCYLDSGPCTRNEIDLGFVHSGFFLS